MDPGIELDLEIPILYADPDSVATCPTYAENLPNDNIDQGTSVRPTHIDFENVPTTLVSCINNVVNDDNVLDLSVAVQPTSNMTSPIVGNSTTTPSTSSVGSSSGKSVTDILDSIIRFKPKSHEAKEKKVRRKLHLPSVMTSADWIALKRASEQEKEEAEKKKEERIKARKAKQEVDLLNLYMCYLPTYFYLPINNNTSLLSIIQELAARKKARAESKQTRQKLKPETRKLKCGTLKLTQPASKKQNKAESTPTNSVRFLFHVISSL